MTDDIDRTIAEALTAHGFDTALAWEPAHQCPQGHLNIGRTPIGGWCDECIVQRWEHRDEYDDPVDTISGVIAWMEQFPDAISRQWRIGRMPHDFTNPAYLVPAVTAYVQSLPYQGAASFGPLANGRGWGDIMAHDEYGDPVRTSSELGTDAMDALRRALCAAIADDEKRGRTNEISEKACRS